MGERKVLNRYVPPDFDPTIIPRTKRDYTRLCEVRMMLPFSLQCLTCGEYMYRGKKFNSKKESIQDDLYLGIRKYRFYIKCANCAAEITFKTDPKNADYEMEGGGTRNFEIWRENRETVEAAETARRNEDDADVMKSLENRTLDSKVEMDILDALDEIKAINQRHERVDTHALLAYHTGAGVTQAVVLNADGITEEDETLLKSIQFKSKANLKRTLADSGSDESDADATATSSASVSASTLQPSVTSMTSSGLLSKVAQLATVQSNAANVAANNSATIVIKKKKKKTDNSSGGDPGNKDDNIANHGKLISGTTVSQKPSGGPAPVPVVPVTAAGMFGDYGSESD